MKALKTGVGKVRPSLKYDHHKVPHRRCDVYGWVSLWWYRFQMHTGIIVMEGWEKAIFCMNFLMLCRHSHISIDLFLLVCGSLLTYAAFTKFIPLCLQYL